MDFENIRLGASENKHEALDPEATIEELTQAAKRLEELGAKGSLSPEEMQEVEGIIRRSADTNAAYEERGLGAKDGQMSEEVAELMKRGAPYTPQEQEVMLTEADRLVKLALSIVVYMEEEYELESELES